MIGSPGDHPLPHLELHRQEPLIFKLGVGGALYRHHQSIHEPIFFGKTGLYCFDDPDCPSAGSFGVLYAGADPECCLLESCGFTTGVPAVSVAYLESRQIARLETPVAAPIGNGESADVAREISGFFHGLKRIESDIR